MFAFKAFNRDITEINGAFMMEILYNLMENVFNICLIKKTHIKHKSFINIYFIFNRVKVTLISVCKTISE